MRAYICIDNRNGISFNKRRESRDRAVIEDIISMQSGRNRELLIEEYSFELFEGTNYEDVIKIKEVRNFDDSTALISDRYDFFVERWDPANKGFDSFVIYRWNRGYPYDLELSENFNKPWKLISSVDLIGTSHEKITRELWQR